MRAVECESDHHTRLDAHGPRAVGWNAMRIPIYQVDAFTAELFSGNPAAVCPLERWLDDRTLQSIAAENNLSETAYMVRRGDGFDLRWFTPTIEVALCGHATLASAFVVFHHVGHAGSSVVFHTRRSGNLEVTRCDDLLTMDFPSRPVRSPAGALAIGEVLGVPADEVFDSEEDLLVVLRDEASVRRVCPDFAAMATLPKRGVIVTARGTDCDFVSRFFAPAAGIPEDPVTGSAHCVLAPFWSSRLGKTRLHARQVSKRGGELFCEARGERVLISGRAVLYLQGSVDLP